MSIASPLSLSENYVYTDICTPSGVAFFGAIAGLCVMIAGYFVANEHDRRLTRITLLTD